MRSAGARGWLQASAERHRDDRSVHDYLGESLVVCPRCAHIAHTRALDSASAKGLVPRRLTCDHCGLTRSLVDGSTRPRRHKNAVVDPFFGMPLWLQAPCCGDVLWAYNTDHLAFLDAFVGARLRERRQSSKYGWSNQALVSRLPAWLKSRKNRADVLVCLNRLRKTLT